jgi:rubrerythrin
MAEDRSKYVEMQNRLIAALETENQAIAMYSSIREDLRKSYPKLKNTSSFILRILSDEKDHKLMLEERLEFFKQLLDKI